VFDDDLVDLENLIVGHAKEMAVACCEETDLTSRLDMEVNHPSHAVVINRAVAVERRANRGDRAGQGFADFIQAQRIIVFQRFRPFHAGSFDATHQRLEREPHVPYSMR
jgi:hypothetical protein